MGHAQHSSQERTEPSIGETTDSMKAMTKSQLAKAAGVNRTTLYRWLKNPAIKRQLAEFNLKTKQKLPPKAVQIICEHYAIEID